jgi:signal transduction histidine kinase/CheY-like chemotaxis protein
MFSSINDYLKKILDFSKEVEGIKASFKDSNLENFYNIQNHITDQGKSTSFLTIVIISNSLGILQSFRNNNNSISQLTYFSICCLLIEVIFYIISKYKKNNITVYRTIKYIRFVYFYCSFYLNICFPISNDLVNCVRFFYMFFALSSVLFIYYMEFNYIIILLMPVLNAIGIFLAGIIRNYSIFNLLPEHLLNITFYYAVFFVKKYDFFTNKKMYFEIYKNEQYINYIKELIDAINTQFICLNQNDVIFMNKCAFYYHYNTQLRMNTENCKNENEETNVVNVKNKVFNFFKTLKICLSETSVSIDESISLYDQLMKFFSENENSDEFNRLGYFHSSETSERFDISVRKLKFKEEVIEILIYDITEIRQAEQIKVEAKYKKRILGKIAHEFKTPLITIVSLINRIIDSEKNKTLDSDLAMNLNHIDNLSNYTLVLISDIIQYVSDSNDLKLFKKEIDLRDILIFSNNVAETLINCNENKASRVKCNLAIGEGIDKIKVFSDENRLKQILLNFVSNSYKFTLNGLIKIKAKHLPEQKIVEISVKDTGIGIKDDQHHLVFQEFTQFSKEKRLNSKGSGLGLSICKTLSDALGHKIGFSSKLGKGSKFYIRIGCKIINENLNNPNNSFCFKKKTKMSFLNIFSNNSLLTEVDKNNENDKGDCFLDQLDDSKNTLSNRQYYHKDLLMNRVLKTEDHKINNVYHNDKTKDDIQYNIVVIDDQQLVRENTVNLIKLVLKSLNIYSIGVIEGTDGIELLNIIRLDTDNKIKCIFVDENMEYLNGSESVIIIRKLEQSNKFKKHLIISISALDDIDSKDKILNSGVDIVIRKPCTKSDLKNILCIFK